MGSAIRFAADKIVKGKAYPALSRHQAEPYTQAWRQFTDHWPYTVPNELHDHCERQNFAYSLHTLDEPADFYTISLGFFDFTVDYIDLLPTEIKRKLRTGQIRLLFYYHEGDNPYTIKSRLDGLCRSHDFDIDCYRFVSGNTRAEMISNFYWLADFELTFWYRNQQTPACDITTNDRAHRFTVLNRTHKWWRATVMADLWRQGLLQDSQWSYRTDVDCGDRPQDNPIEIDSFPDLRADVNRFLSGCPYTCDSLDPGQQNDHHHTESQHYTNSWCSIILETHFDADGSQGAFLTEKTFRAIKNGHPFVIVGCPGSLAALRSLGYKTFDHAIDNSYDQETNNTERYRKVLKAIKDLSQLDMRQWFDSLRDDVLHNQKLFLAPKYDRLNTLFNRLQQT